MQEGTGQRCPFKFVTVFFPNGKKKTVPQWEIKLNSAPTEAAK
jgi:hypothetical protein